MEEWWPQCLLLHYNLQVVTMGNEYKGVQKSAQRNASICCLIWTYNLYMRIDFIFFNLWKQSQKNRAPPPAPAMSKHAKTQNKKWALGASKYNQRFFKQNSNLAWLESNLSQWNKQQQKISSQEIKAKTGKTDTFRCLNILADRLNSCRTRVLRSESIDSLIKV